MPKIILCRGIQGSGKSTWARKWVLEDPEHRVRFNNDDIRNMNLSSHEYVAYRDMAAHHDRFEDDSCKHYIIEYKDFFTPLEVCIERDSKRENPIGEEVIRATYEKYKHIIG